LSAPMAVGELVAALRKLKYGRMVGPDGLRGEFLKGLYVEPPVINATLQKWVVMHEYDTSPGSVLGDLCSLLNAVFDGVRCRWSGVGRVYQLWVTLLCWTITRGIAVGSALGKVLSLLLHTRLSQWSEERGCRAAWQAGFRDCYRTSDHVFVLKHLVDRCKVHGSPLKVTHMQILGVLEIGLTGSFGTHVLVHMFCRL